MYVYDYPPNELKTATPLPNNCVAVLDITPTQYPYVPRICANQGYYLIWYTDEKEFPEVTPHARRAKIEDTQSISLPDPNKIEYGQVLVYPYEDEVVIGVLKYYGYMQRYGRVDTYKIIKELWADVVNMFGNKRIICPTGTYMELLHLAMNQKRIPRNSYNKDVMTSLGFYKTEDYWIRDADILA